MDAIETLDGALVPHGPHNDRIYRHVFKSYPFPVHLPVFLKHMMREGVRYFAVRIDGRMAAMAAAEMERTSQYAEMTDFARCRNTAVGGWREPFCVIWRKTCACSA